MKLSAVFISFWAIFASFCGSARADPELTVFAAASLGEALSSALADYDGLTRISVGGSGAIARQVAQGAPADVVMLANPVWADWLEKQGYLIAGSRAAPIGNHLVVVGPLGADALPSLDLGIVLQRLGESGRIAIGEHRSVPAGQYAKLWMESRALWDPLKSRLAEVENVRGALALVSRNEVPLAILYASDVVAAPDAATIVWQITEDHQPNIVYSVAAITPAGVPLARYLSSTKARHHFKDFGFTEVSP